jgi:hypothetical protein
LIDLQYDELIPSTIDTARRGFYVNTGVLEFRSIASDDDDDTNGKRVPSTSKKLKPTLAKKVFDLLLPANHKMLFTEDVDKNINR